MFRKFAPFEASRTFEFRDPDTNYLYKASNLGDLYKQIITYRVQNDLEPIESLNMVVENYLCSLPENCNKCTGVELHRSFMTYVKGGVALLKQMMFPKFVTQDVAEKRALQCATCKFNEFPDKGEFLKFADEVAISQVGERHVSNEKELGSCMVCTCVLRSKVFYDGKLPKFNDEDTEKLKSVMCWQLKLSGQG